MGDGSIKMPHRYWNARPAVSFKNVYNGTAIVQLDAWCKLAADE